MLALRWITCAAAALALAATAAVAADYPDKPVKVIVPFQTGGMSDTTARIFQRSFEKGGHLGQPGVIDDAQSIGRHDHHIGIEPPRQIGIGKTIGQRAEQTTGPLDDQRLAALPPPLGSLDHPLDIDAASFQGGGRRRCQSRQRLTAIWNIQVENRLAASNDPAARTMRSQVSWKRSSTSRPPVCRWMK